MKTSRFNKFTAVLLLALGLNACGGGASPDVAGIGGTGITATGQITGFGSIFVNGVEYFIQDGATIMVNGAPAQEINLRLGMIVTLSGTLNRDGITGTVDNVAYEAELKGPVTAIDPNGPDPEDKLKTLVILGKSVIINAISTSFGEGYSFAGITVNDIVEVSGYVIDNSGTLQATRIEKEGVYIPGASTQIEVKGTVTDFPLANSFELDGGVLTVNFDPDGINTNMQSLLSGIVIGDALEIKGTFTNPTTIFATEIKLSDDGLPDNAEQVEIEGVITNFVSPGNFKVNGQKIDATSAELEPASLTLEDGVFVEIEGAVVNGTLEATSVKTLNTNIEIEAYVASDPVNNTIRLQITSNGFIDVTVDSNQTQMEDDVSNTPITLSSISNGDFLKIAAYQDGNGGIIATEIKRLTSDEGEIMVEGPVSLWTWTLSGGNLEVTFLDDVTLTSDSGTSFEQDDQPLPGGAADMDNLLNTPGASTILKVSDEIPGSTVSDGVVDEIKIKT